jgi:cellulose synthase/poly-beta-1,6-N-acetylglucosamine synthase-like glycosyltransferase
MELNLLLSILETGVFFFFSVIVFYTTILAVAGLFVTPTPIKEYRPKSKIAVLVPSYMEDDVILEVARSYSRVEYPSDLFDVYVIADKMRDSTVTQLREIVKVIEVSFDVSTKAKSLNYALNHIKEEYDLVLINDADNILEPTFLERVDYLYQNGYRAIQGQRMAKNTNTEYAILDAVSEVINNHIYRKGLNGLGCSCALIGSGMAFEFSLLKNLLSQNKAVGGFDKVLQLALVEHGTAIKYEEAAIVFDEKVEESSSFRNQRKRWISSQVKYALKNVGKSFRLLFKGNFNYFNLSFFTSLMQPRILVFAGLSLFALFSIIFQQWLSIDPAFWVVILIIYIAAMLISIPRHYYIGPLFQAFFKIPSVIFNLVFAFTRIKHSDKSFIHTKHQTVGVNNVFYQKQVHKKKDTSKNTV